VQGESTTATDKMILLPARNGYQMPAIDFRSLLL
jgi:hypothetical protein